MARRLLWCIEQAETPRPVTDTFGDVHRAATKLQKCMGLWQPDGDAFWIYYPLETRVYCAK
ncbi:hypothetical protein JR782_005033 [Salmonella enterica subsp. enterica serovar Eastbourne]|nr:hypothetical protein [Salmonella enterica subsp. enterica serovar Eastbourne]EHC5910456.1 hypothetical protein [Salmonella enterica subsp. enterica serovar Eastbourne]EJW4862064.1 hypothetical protein [Salmonella enterica]